MGEKTYTIGILGAGSIGCYVGGLLCNLGCAVSFLGREATGISVLNAGMTLSSLEQNSIHVGGGEIDWGHKPQHLAQCDIVIVCTKSGDTFASGKLINEHCRKDAVIVSMQNGIGNTDLLLETCGGREVLSAMVSFNIVRIAEVPLRFHQGSEGEIILSQHKRTKWLSERLLDTDVKSSTVADIMPIVWGKLLMNLNNAINALSGIPLKQQLQNRAYRLLLADSVEEALSIMKAADIAPARIGKVPPILMPLILRLPDFIFKTLAKTMLNIDEEARSSMWEDLQAARQPEIDFLNGAICELGHKIGKPTPVNDAIVRLVNDLFNQKIPVHLSATELSNAIGSGDLIAN